MPIDYRIEGGSLIISHGESGGSTTISPDKEKGFRAIIFDQELRIYGHASNENGVKQIDRTASTEELLALIPHLLPEAAPIISAFINTGEAIEVS